MIYAKFISNKRAEVENVSGRHVLYRSTCIWHSHTLRTRFL